MTSNAIRPIDRARAARLIQAQILGDAEMFAFTVHEMFEEDFGLAGMGATINALRCLSEDLGGVLVDIHGTEIASAMMSAVIVGHTE